MRIEKNTVVTLEAELFDLWDEPIRQTGQPIVYLHGGYDQILDALESALAGRQPGERITLDLEPEHAFGEYDETLLRVEPRAIFPEALAVGMQFEGIPGEDDDDTLYAVTDIADGKVVLDGNHALAGIAVRFRVTVRDVRAATPGEIAQGHADDPGDAPVLVAH